MQKTKVVKFKGALKLLGISYATFYQKYRKQVKPCGTQGRCYLYSIEDLKKRQKQLEEEKKYNAKFEIVEL